MKATGYYHIFPFSEIRRGEQIVLWGMGEVGHHYLKQIEATGFCDVVYAVDSHLDERKRNVPIPVFAPKKVKDCSYRIVIANGSKKSADAIRKKLSSWGVAPSQVLWNDLIVDEPMVMDEGIDSVTKTGVVKRTGYYHIFPFHRIAKGSDVILYGMGEVGHHYQKQLALTDYAHVSYVSDRSYEGKEQKGKAVPPSALTKYSSQLVVIANGDASAAEEITERLERLGFSSDQIVYEDIIISGSMCVNERRRVDADGPVIDGSESELSHRVSPNDLAFSLLPYDVISFDVFDTLILRPFADPKDMFMVLGEKLRFFGFTQQRIAAEKKARLRKKYTRGTTEVTLAEIYEILEEETGIDKEYGQKLELETEQELCFANPYMLEVFRMLRGRHKKIILTSDMYLKKDEIASILHACGYDGWEQIYVSCEYSTSKGGEGGLYRMIKNIYGKDLRYVHVGDNEQSDVRSAKKNGFQAVYYQNVNEIGNPHRAHRHGMSEFVGSAYAGLVNAHLHNGLHTYNPYYEHGFIYGGLYVLGYMQWLDDYAKTNGIDKILFLARDGEIYKRVYDMLPGHLPDAYVYWSRIPQLRLEAARNRFDFFRRNIEHHLYDVYPPTFREIFESLHLEQLIEQLPAFSLDEHQVVTRDVMGGLKAFFCAHWDLVLKTYEEETEAARQYLQAVIGKAENVAVIDIGWTGSGPMAIKYLVEEKWNLPCKVTGVVAANYSDDPSIVISHAQSEKIKSYIFNRFQNRNLYDFHTKTNHNSNNIFFELFTQGASPTCTGFDMTHDRGLKIQFGKSEWENYAAIREIHRGIEDFVRGYRKHFKSCPYLFRISGYDAYVPFRFVAGTPSYFQKKFGGIKITCGLETKEVPMETLAEILKKRGF